MKIERLLIDGKTGEVLRTQKISIKRGETSATIYPDQVVIERVWGKMVAFQMDNIRVFPDEIVLTYMTEN